MPFRILKPGEVQEPKGVLLTGQPNSGKTQSLVTFLATYPTKLAAYVCYPDEQGSSTFPSNHPNVAVRIAWDDVDPSKKISYSALWSEVLTVTTDILIGKHGKVELFFGDGLHKLYRIALGKATGGISSTTLDFDAKLYYDAKELFLNYIHTIQRAASIYLPVFTVWEGREKDNPDSLDKHPTRHIFPDFPGQLAKQSVGEFGVVLYALRKGTGIEGAKYLWQTRPLDLVGGCGIKKPIEVSSKIEDFVPQDWSLLAPRLGMVETTDQK